MDSNNHNQRKNLRERLQEHEDDLKDLFSVAYTDIGKDYCIVSQLTQLKRNIDGYVNMFDCKHQASIVKRAILSGYYNDIMTLEDRERLDINSEDDFLVTFDEIGTLTRLELALECAKH